MLNDKRCFLCFVTNHKQKGFVCDKCLVSLEQLKCYFCLRCGKKNCLGCHKISEFQSLYSLYSYSSGLAEILLLAKEQNNFVYRKLFYDLFFASCKKYLTTLFFKEKYHHVILPILKKERILYSSWHPAEFFYDVFVNILKNLDEENKKTILLQPRFIKKLKKQSLLPKKSRNETSITAQLKKNMLDTQFLQNVEIFAGKKILILDDVLTTGQTAIMMKKNLEMFFIDCEWHFFSLLRSPQKEES